ncbi:MAG: aminopeptidase P family protein [Cyclobacteriaceae bacterium]
MELFEPHIYKARRDQLRATVGSGKLLILGNDEASINFKDNWYPFRQDSTFRYYFGISLPGLVGVLDADSGDDFIFGNDLTIDDIIWTGPQPTVMDLAQQVAVTQTKPLGKLPDQLLGRIHYLPPYRNDHTVLLSQLLSISNEEAVTGYSIDLIRAVVTQRSIKSDEEIAELNKAASTTSDMHLQVMQAAKAGMKEYELVGIASKAAFDHHVAFSFPPIMTINGQTLHNHYHGNTIKQGDLLLFDGGCETRSGYAGDMTRTFPVSGQFDSRQKELYDVVYSAHLAAIEALAPGTLYKEIHLLAAKKLVEGLTQIGLMKGDADEAVAAGAHTMFFQCGLGHMMGMDVHDMENLGEQFVGYTPELIKSKEFGLKSLRLGRALEPGFVLTVEPGIYIIPDLIDMNKEAGKFEGHINYDLLNEYRDFGGIRVEDDFVITESGADLLGTPLASSASDIEVVRTNAEN